MTNITSSCEEDRSPVMEAEVWITGVGIRTPHASTASELLERATDGQPTRFEVDTEAVPGKSFVVARVPEEAPEQHLGRKAARELDRAAGLGLLALVDACAQAGLEPGPEPDPEVAVLYGTAFGGVPSALAISAEFHTDPAYRIPGLTVVRCLAGAAAYHAARRHGAGGPSRVLSTACSSGLLALVEGLELLRAGRAHRALVFAADAPVAPLILRAWDALGVMTKGAATPTTAYRPFHANRDGFAMAEGSAAMVLELADAARARGAPCLARVLAARENTSTTGITAPDVAAQTRLMREVLADADLAPDDVTAVFAHASGTPRNDRLEAEAIAAVLGEDGPWTTTTKGVVGHCMGASGLVEAVGAVTALGAGRVPPVTHLDQLDPRCPVRVPPPEGAELGPGAVLVNSLAFGGNNVMALLAGPEDEDA
jgi:3-oxoacyl-[acyl-carrier-protein] synthase II